MTLERWNDALEKRGILEQAKRLGWQDCEWRGVPGWKYPLYTAKGERFGSDSWRWKAVSPDAQRRFAWFDKPEHCEYYWSAKDMEPAIAQMNGQLNIVAGESDMLTLLAFDYVNVTTFFGEGSIPQDIMAHMEKLGVCDVIYWADNDDTGHDDAQKLNEIFAQSTIGFTCYAPPYPYNDLNEWAVATNYELSPYENFRRLKFRELDIEPAAVTTGGRLDVDAYREAITTALNADWKRATRSGWSKHMPCIFQSHENDHKSPAATWNMDKGVYRCFKCGETWKSDEVATQLGININDYRTQVSLPSEPPLKQHEEPAQQEPIEDVFFTSDQSLDRLLDRIEGNVTSDVLPIINPITTLHQYGGFARMLKPGKLVGILGLSGGGKTSFMESMFADPFRQIGVSGLWWGPEWSWEEYSDRALQRYGGVTTDDIANHETWLIEERRRKEGKPATKYGKPLTKAQMTSALETVQLLKNWEGKTYYTQKLDVSLDTLLNIQQRKVDELRGLGVQLSYAVWDYIQLAEIIGARSERERIQTAIRRVKTFCVENKLVGFVASQPTKAASSDAKNDGTNVDEDTGKVNGLGAEAAQFMRDWEFNLFLTLTPAYRDSEPLGWGQVEVVKNSQGKTGKVKMVTDFARLRWVDEQFRGQ